LNKLIYPSSITVKILFSLALILFLITTLTLPAFAGSTDTIPKVLIEDYKAFYKNDKIAQKYITRVESSLSPKLQQDMFTIFALTNHSFADIDKKEKQNFVKYLLKIFQAISDNLSKLEETKLSKFLLGKARNASPEFKEVLTAYIKKHDAIMEISIIELDKKLANNKRVIAEQNKTLAEQNKTLAEQNKTLAELDKTIAKELKRGEEIKKRGEEIKTLLHAVGGNESKKENN
jgi:uncharacterized coiled-coil protein SlyX